MADDLLDLDLGSTEEQEHTNKVEKRIKDLSEKVRVTATERDEIKAQADKAEAEKATALKDVDFFKNFNATASQYQGALEYQDRIKEKVDLGYNMEDAMISVLAKEGKLNPQNAQTPPPPKESPAGGSATTTITNSGDKTIGELTREEKRAKLMEAESKGDLTL